MVSLSNHPALSGATSFDRLTMSGGSRQLDLARTGFSIKAISASTRRSGESRNPERSVAGTLFSGRIFWIPAFAGTTVALVMTVARIAIVKMRLPGVNTRYSQHELVSWPEYSVNR